MEDNTTVIADSATDELEIQPEDFKEVYGKMCTDEAQVSNALKMVEGLVRDGFATMAIVISDRIGETGGEVPLVVPNTAVMEYYINAEEGDRTKDALRVFKQMSVSGVEPNPYTYGVIIKALAAADLEKNPGFVVYAKKYFVEMLDKGMQPTEESFEAVLEGIARRGNKAEAEEELRKFVESLKAKGFGLVLKKEAEEKASPPMKSEMDMLKEHVMKVFDDAIRDCKDKEVQKRFTEIGKDYESLSNFAFTLNQVLQRVGLGQDANDLFKPLVETAILPDEVVFIIVMHIYAAAKNKGDVLKVYEHMLAYGITPSSCTYNLLIAQLAPESDFIGNAKELFLEMLDKGMKPFLQTSLAVVNGIACLESAENAMEFIAQVRPKAVFPDASGESCFIEFVNGMKLYDDLRKKITDKDIQEVVNDIHIHGHDKQLAKMLCAMMEDGDVDEARELFDPTGQPCINPLVIVYTAAVEAYIDRGKTEGTLQTYLDMVAGGLAPISYTCSVLIKGLAADPNYFEDAKKYLIEMMDKGMHPNAATYTAVFEGFAREDDKAVEEAGKKFVEVMMLKGLVPNPVAMRKALKGRPKSVITRVMNIIFK